MHCKSAISTYEESNVCRQLGSGPHAPTLLKLQICQAVLETQCKHVLCRLVGYFKDAVAPLGVGMGLYFSRECNITLTQQAASKVRKGMPLWQSSEHRSWINETLLQPICSTLQLSHLGQLPDMRACLYANCP